MSTSTTSSGRLVNFPPTSGRGTPSRTSQPFSRTTTATVALVPTPQGGLHQLYRTEVGAIAQGTGEEEEVVVVAAATAVEAPEGPEAAAKRSNTGGRNRPTDRCG